LTRNLRLFFVVGLFEAVCNVLYLHGIFVRIFNALVGTWHWEKTLLFGGQTFNPLFIPVFGLQSPAKVSGFFNQSIFNTG